MKKFHVVISSGPIEQIAREQLTTVRAADFQAAALAGLGRALRRGEVTAPGSAYAMVAAKVAENFHPNGLPFCWHGFELKLAAKEGAAA